MLILTINVNFHLKLKERGINNDPALGDGWAHWVTSEPYRAYYKKYGYQAEVSSFILNLLSSSLNVHISPTTVTQSFVLLIMARPTATLLVGLLVWVAVYADAMALYERMG